MKIPCYFVFNTEIYLQVFQLHHCTFQINGMLLFCQIAGNKFTNQNINSHKHSWTCNQNKDTYTQLMPEIARHATKHTTQVLEEHE